MSAWRLQEAKEDCETVFDRAWGGEPQIIMRDEKPMVVVVSYVDYRQAASAPSEERKSFVDALLSCPKRDDGEELGRAVSPLTQALSGVAQVPDDFVDRDLVAKAALEKYGELP